MLSVIATIQGREKQSCLTWSGITIGKLPPQLMFLYSIELFNTYCHNPRQSKVVQSNLEWYYYQTIQTLLLLPPPPRSFTIQSYFIHIATLQGNTIQELIMFYQQDIHISYYNTTSGRIIHTEWITTGQKHIVKLILKYFIFNFQIIVIPYHNIM